MFQRLLQTKTYIDDTTTDHFKTRDSSVTAKHVLNKAEEIHTNVDADLLKTVSSFKTDVETQKKQLPQGEHVIVDDVGSQISPKCADVAIQTEEADFWVVLSDESDSEFVTRDEESLDTGNSGIVAQLVGGYKAAKSRLQARLDEGGNNQAETSEVAPSGLTKVTPAKTPQGSSAAEEKSDDPDYWPVVSDLSDNEEDSSLITQLVDAAKSRLGVGTPPAASSVPTTSTSTSTATGGIQGRSAEGRTEPEERSSSQSTSGLFERMMDSIDLF